MIKEIVIVRYVTFLCCWSFTKNSTASIEIIPIKSLQKTLHNLINLPLSSTAKYDNKVKKDGKVRESWVDEFTSGSPLRLSHTSLFAQSEAVWWD